MNRSYRGISCARFLKDSRLCIMFEYKMTLGARFFCENNWKQMKTWLKFAHASVREQSRDSFILDPHFNSGLVEPAQDRSVPDETRWRSYFSASWQGNVEKRGRHKEPKPLSSSSRAILELRNICTIIYSLTFDSYVVDQCGNRYSEMTIDRVQRMKKYWERWR